MQETRYMFFRLYINQRSLVPCHADVAVPVLNIRHRRYIRSYVLYVYTLMSTGDICILTDPCTDTFMYINHVLNCVGLESLFTAWALERRKRGRGINWASAAPWYMRLVV